MKTSIWYHVDEKLPTSPGHQLVFIGPSMVGDGGIATAYFDGDDWRERIATHSPRAYVVYWCDADPWDWYNNPSPAGRSSPVMEKAWQNVLDAVSKYEMLKALSYASI